MEGTSPSADSSLDGQPLSRRNAVDGSVISGEKMETEPSLGRRRSIVRLERRPSNVQELMEDAMQLESNRLNRSWSDVIERIAPGDPMGEAMELVPPSHSRRQSNVSLDSVSPGSPYAHTRLVFSWGRGDLGALLWPDVEDHSADVEAPVSRKRIMTAAGSMYHAVGITATGEVYACGSNDEGQVLTDSAFGEEIVQDGYRIVPAPVMIEALYTQRAVAVACGLYHTIVLTASGKVVSWGSNEMGQLGHGSSSTSSQIRRRVRPKAMVGMGAIAAIGVAAGDEYSLVLGADGTVYSCGDGHCCGSGEEIGRDSLETVANLTGEAVSSICAGPKHAGAISATGKLYCWGSNSHGQCGQAPKTSPEGEASTLLLLPSRVEFTADSANDGAVSAAMGMSHTLCAMANGKVRAFGRNTCGQLGIVDSDQEDIVTPEEISFFGPEEPASTVACGWDHSLVLTASGCLYGFGKNDSGQLLTLKKGENVEVVSSTEQEQHIVRMPTVIEQLRPVFVQKVFAFAEQSIALGVARYDLLMRTSSASSGQPLSRRFSVIGAMSEQIGIGPNTILDALTDMEVEADQTSGGVSSPTAAGSGGRAANALSTEEEGLVRTISDVYASVNRLGASFLSANVAQLDARAADMSITRAMDKLGSTLGSRLAGALETAVTNLEKVPKESLQPATVRVFLLLWMLPINSDRSLTGGPSKKGPFVRLLKLIAEMSQECKVVLGRFICECIPEDILTSRLLEPIHVHLSHALQSNTKGHTLPVLAMVAHDLYTFSEAVGHMIAPDKFYNDGFTKLDIRILLDDLYSLSNTSEEVKKRRFFLNRFPELIPAETKLVMMQIEARVQQAKIQQQVMMNQMMSQFLGGQRLPELPFLVLSVDRDNLVRTALTQLAAVPETDLQKELKVQFIGEDGVDEGGVRKEFYQLITEQLFDVQFGMFSRMMNDRIVWFNQACTWEAENYKVIGKLVALAIYNGVILDLSFPNVLYKKLLGHSLTLEDLDCLDPELLQGFKKLLDYEPAEQVEDIFCLTYQVSWSSLGENHTVELLPGGKDIPVTGENRADYVEKYMRYLLIDSVKEQFAPFREGFVRVMGSSKVVQLLTAKELEYLVVGEPQLDFHALEEGTEYVGFSSDDPFIRQFWSVVHSMDLESQQKLLMFVTGSSKAPVGGLGKLTFRIQRAGPDSNHLPTSHTCFNVLLLPEYDTMAKLHDRLHIAIREHQGFGLQ